MCQSLASVAPSAPRNGKETVLATCIVGRVEMRVGASENNILLLRILSGGDN